jgi:integrase
MSRPRKTDRHLPPCVYQRHSSYWYVKGGRWVNLGKDRRGALERYALLASEPSSGMADLIDAAMIEIRRKVKPSTARQYDTAARRLKRMMVEFSPDQVLPKHVAKIKVSMASKPNMANRMLSVLRQVFAYAVEQQLVDSNPALGIERYGENKRDRYITDIEYAAIYEKAGPRLQIIMDLCYLTAQRVSDVLAIPHADITETGVRFKQGKTGEKMAVRWSADLRATVERARKLRGNVIAMTLLSNRRRKSPDYRTVRDQWAEACEAAGVKDAHLHDLRAKSLTDAKAQGRDPTALAGHKSAAMTERYIRLREFRVVDGPSFRQPIDSEKKAVDGQ